MIKKMLTELRRMEKHSGSFNKELENIKKKIKAEEYNNWNEKYTRWNQQQIRQYKRTYK